MIKAAENVVKNAVQAAPPKSKAELQKLLERKTAAQAVVDEVKNSTRDQREAALGDSFLAEAETKTKAAEAAAAKADEAEQPWLIGTSLSLKATQELLEKCSGVATEAQ